MSDVKLEWTPFPIGTTVDIYPRRSELMMPDYSPPPFYAKVGSGVVADDTSLTLADLPTGELWAIANPPIGRGYLSFHAH